MTPGVYFYKDASGEIIYIGKAANLRSRVRQYFQKSRTLDLKTDALIAEIADVDWTQVETEADALFLEAELVRRYMPRFNILLRDDKSLQYARIDYKSDYPTVSLVRRPLDDGAEYFGPYLNSLAIKRALKYLRRAFPYATHRPLTRQRANLHYHLGLDPGLEAGHTSLNDYRANLRKLMQYLKGQRVALSRDIEREMKREAKAKNFEKAGILRNQLFAMQELGRKTLFGDREAIDASLDRALVELADLLSLEKPPRQIEGFDISHMGGTDNAASMVVFTNGVPDKAAYRKFKMRLHGNDDFTHMSEVITRRFRENNRKKWGLPDLILIDGGKGQLAAALSAQAAAGVQIPTFGLSKRQEEIIIKGSSLPAKNTVIATNAKRAGAYTKVSGEFLTVALPQSSHLVKLLQRIRDESHRFAVSYHSTLKSHRQTASLLDEVPGVGPHTRRKLLRHFGSLKGIMEAETAQLAEVVGPNKAELLNQYFKNLLK